MTALDGTVLAVLLSLVSAAGYALAAVAQARLASASAGGRGALRALLARGQWWWAVGLNAAGALAHVAALHYGPLTLVQPLGALTLVAALPLGAYCARRRVTRAEWRGALWTLAGLVGLVSVTGPVKAGEALTLREALVVAAATVLLIAALASGRLYGGGSRGRRRAVADAAPGRPAFAPGSGSDSGFGLGPGLRSGSGSGSRLRSGSGQGSGLGSGSGSGHAGSGSGSDSGSGSGLGSGSGPRLGSGSDSGPSPSPSPNGVMGRGLGHAAASGIASGVASALTQTLTAALAREVPGGAMAWWQTALVAVLISAFAMGGLLLSQTAYRGGLAAPLAVVNLSNPAAAAVIGVALLGETFRAGAWGWLIAGAAAVAAARGVVLLTTGQGTATSTAPAPATTLASADGPSSHLPASGVMAAAADPRTSREPPAETARPVPVPVPPPRTDTSSLALDPAVG